jgi:hypothetical protein
MSTSEIFLVAMGIIFLIPYLIWRVGSTEYYAPLVVVQIITGILLGPGLLGALYPHYYVYRMIRRKAFAAGIKTRIGNHPFRATGITQYLRNCGRRELAQQMAAHESPRTTALYDRRDDEVAVDEVERILI